MTAKTKDKLGKKAQKAVAVVWNNTAAHRYIPRGYGNGGHGWGVWDTVEGQYVEGNRALSAIDPSTPAQLS